MKRLLLFASLVVSGLPAAGAHAAIADGAAAEDTTPPAVTIHGSGQILRQQHTRLSASGTAGTAPGDEPFVSVDYPDGLEIPVQAGGYWEWSSDQIRSEGFYGITVTQRDAAGNVGTDTTTVQIDRTGPKPTIDPWPGPACDRTPTITGTAGTANGDLPTVRFSLGNVVAQDGKWSWTPQTPLADGVYDVYASQSDDLGNAGDSAQTGYLVVDCTGPALAVDPMGPTNDTTPAISGQLGTGTEHTADESTADVIVRRAGTVVAEMTVAAGPGGAFSSQLPALTQDGEYEVTFVQADQIGNTTEVVRTFRLDTTAPTPAPGFPDGLRTNDTTPTLDGTAGTAAGDATQVLVDVYEGGAPTGTKTTLTAARAGSGWTVTPPALAPGPHAVVVRQLDDAGNEGASTARTIVIDLIAPVPAIDAPAARSGDATPVLAGDAGVATGDLPSVQVTLSGPGGATRTLQATVTAGRWSAEITQPLADGEWTASAAQDDDAGNHGTSAARTWTVDTTRPAVTLTTPASGTTTSDTTPSLAGAAGTAPGDLAAIRVRVFAGPAAAGEPVQTLTTVAFQGTWSVDAGALEPGTYTAVAEQADDLGNQGSSTPVTFTVSATEPVVVPTATPTPAPTPAPAVADTTAPAILLLSLRGNSWRTLARRGRFHASAAVDEAAALRFDLLIGARTARRLGISGPATSVGGRAYVRLARTRRGLTRAADTRGRLSRASRRRLASTRRLDLLVRLTATDAAGNAAVQTRRLRLRR